MRGRDIVAVYTKRQEPHEEEFAIDTLQAVRGKTGRVVLEHRASLIVLGL